MPPEILNLPWRVEKAGAANARVVDNSGRPICLMEPTDAVTARELAAHIAEAVNKAKPPTPNTFKVGQLLRYRRTGGGFRRGVVRRVMDLHDGQGTEHRWPKPVHCRYVYRLALIDEDEEIERTVCEHRLKLCDYTLREGAPVYGVSFIKGKRHVNTELRGTIEEIEPDELVEDKYVVRVDDDCPDRYQPGRLRRGTAQEWVHRDEYHHKQERE